MSTRFADEEIRQEMDKGGWPFHRLVALAAEDPTVRPVLSGEVSVEVLVYLEAKVRTLEERLQPPEKGARDGLEAC